MFDPGSRYENVPDAIYADPSGRQITYKRLRRIPDPPAFQAHAVVPADRPDLIAFRFYQDPEQFWRLADGNDVMRPEELTAEVGRRIAVPLPQG